jgi:alpha-tubulin suppressor-like RCC1 family protein
MPIQSLGGCLKDIFITEAEIIDRYVGNQLWGMGDGVDGRLGNNSTIDRSSPVQTISGGTNWAEISAGCTTVAAIKTNGTLWLWGSGGSGRLGNNSTVDRSSPVQTVSAGTNWRQVSVGNWSVGAIKTDGTLWLWGAGANGKMANNSVVDRSSPVQTISGGTNWKQVSSGDNFLGAIKTDGTLWMWGCNTNGELGTNNVVHSSSPVQTVSAGTNWKQLSLGYTHSGAIKTDGTLWMWGINAAGQLGGNNVITRSSPVQTVSGGTNWKQLSVGCTSTAAIKTDGTLWLWGEEGNGGRLGNNSTNVPRSSPVQTVSGGTNWKQVGLGRTSGAAVKTDGTLWLWGDNSAGQLGLYTAGTDRSSPVQEISAGRYWKAVCHGSDHTMAITFTEA